MVPIPVLKVLKPGVYCALQDTGRFGYRHLGVPYSGAMDRHSYLYANQQVGNFMEAPELEIYGSGTVFLVLSNCILFICGAESEISINGDAVQTSSSFFVYVGQKIKIEKIVSGARLYISVNGGFYSTSVMSSFSTLKGTHLIPFKKNDIIYKVPVEVVGKQKLAGIRNFKINKKDKIQVLPGPEYNWLSDTSMEVLESNHFLITHNSNRMGYRLLGHPLQKNNQKEMLTSAVLPGTVQLLPDGQLIVLMRDCQTTGGYPRILQVEELGICQLAQRLPGEEVTFQLDF